MKNLSPFEKVLLFVLSVVFLVLGMARMSLYLENKKSAAKMQNHPERANRCSDDDWKTSWPARVNESTIECVMADKLNPPDLETPVDMSKPPIEIKQSKLEKSGSAENTTFDTIYWNDAGNDSAWSWENNVYVSALDRYGTILIPTIIRTDTTTTYNCPSDYEKHFVDRREGFTIMDMQHTTGNLSIPKDDVGAYALCFDMKFMEKVRKDAGLLTVRPEMPPEN